MTEALLEVAGLYKIFGSRAPEALALARDGLARDEITERTDALVAVRDAGFEIRRGESFIVMGLSGSGKSTLLRCLARLIEPTSGHVAIDGTSVLDLSADELLELRRGRLAMVFQHFGLLPHRSVLGNVIYGLEVQGVAKADQLRAGLEALDQVGLSEWADSYPGQLSGGMQQRVGLARALAVQPEIVFFDEPFSALDPLIRRDMQNQLLDLQRHQRRTILFITHDFDEALRLGDRIAIMRDGAIEQIGTAQELVLAPATSYVEEFTRNVARAGVVTVGSVLAPPTELTAAPVAADTLLEKVLPRLLVDARPVPVVDHEDRHVGDVDRRAVRAILETDGP